MVYRVDLYTLDHDGSPGAPAYRSDHTFFVQTGDATKAIGKAVSMANPIGRMSVTVSKVADDACSGADPWNVSRDRRDRLLNARTICTWIRQPYSRRLG